MFVLSVLFMTAWTIALLNGFGGFAHLLGIASIAIILVRGERRHSRRRLNLTA
jgi:hypothetical protein